MRVVAGLLRRARRAGHARHRARAARPRSPSSWPRPSATSRSAPRPSPTRAKRRRASTSPAPREIAAENDLRTKRIALDQLVGRANVAPKPLAVPVALPPLAPANVDEWVTRADAEHPPMRRARLALDIAQARDREGAGRPPADRRPDGELRPRPHRAGTATGGPVQRAPSTRQREHRRAAERAAVRRLLDPEPRSRKRWCSKSKSRNDLETARRASRRPRARRSTACSRARRR